MQQRLVKQLAVVIVIMVIMVVMPVFGVTMLDFGHGNIHYNGLIPSSEIKEVIFLSGISLYFCVLLLYAALIRREKLEPEKKR